MPAPLPAPPKHVLIGYNVHSDLAGYLHERRPDLEIRSKRFVEVTPDDMEWAEAYVGFRRPPVRDWGSVRWVHCVGAGVDAFLFRDPIPDDVLLTRADEPFGPQIAEWCLARALTETQHLFALYEAQREHRWAARHISTLAGSRVLVVGTGEVGSAIARLFAAAGCSVDGVSRSATPGAPFGAMHPVSALPNVVGDARWIVLAMPLTEETYHTFDRALLERCRGAYLINVGRGALVEEAALPEALDRGWLRGAALDVFEVEPLPGDSPLWDRADVIVSPHVAGLTTTAGAGDGFLAALAELARGERPRFTVDRDRGY
jgi:phosphoglycerate dehydrogenase-like enzyme